MIAVVLIVNPIGNFLKYDDINPWTYFSSFVPIWLVSIIVISLLEKGLHESGKKWES